MADTKPRVIEAQLNDEELEKLRQTLGGSYNITTKEDFVAESLANAEIGVAETYDRNFDRFDRTRE